MEDMIEGLMTKVGISKEQAEQVVEYLKENSGKVVEYLQEKGIADAVKDKIPGGLGKLF